MGAKTNQRSGTLARARHLRGSASKARRVLNLIRNRSVQDARTILEFSEVGAAQTVSKILESAIANAYHNDGIDADDLFISACFADEGVTMKRFRPRARGRASRINKRTSHITIIVSRYDPETLDARRERQAVSAGSSAARSQARRRRVERSKGAEGAENEDTDANSAEVMETSAEQVSAKTDLTDITGIGPVFASQLQQLGVADISALAELDDPLREQIRDEIKGDDIDGWISQAQEIVEGRSVEGPSDSEQGEEE